MGMSVSTSMSFENRELMNNFSKSNSQESSVVAKDVPEPVLKNTASYSNGIPLTTQQYLILASTQITINNSLKETLKYLRNHAEKNKKTPEFGDLWKIFSAENEESEKNPYEGELLTFEIDETAKNIFAA